MQVFEQQTGLFKDPLFARSINMHKHLCGGQDGRESVHNCVRLCTLTLYSTKKPALCRERVGWMGNDDLHQAFGCFMVVVLHAVFVPNDLTVELVHQLINGRIQIGM